MPYYARKHQLARSLVYHVYNRSNAREFIFNIDADYRYFIGLLKDYVKKFSLKIYHWAIMSNHYHLALEIAIPEQISSFLAGLQRSYACYHHRAYGTSGFLWQGRFKLQPVQKDSYLTACGRYIERNPVEAHIVEEAQEYPYSSAAFYCFNKVDGLTIEDPLFSNFGKSASERQAAYREFLKRFDAEEMKNFANLGQPLGDEEFLRRLINLDGRYIPRRKGRPAGTAGQKNSFATPCL